MIALDRHISEEFEYCDQAGAGGYSFVHSEYMYV